MYINTCCDLFPVVLHSTPTQLNSALIYPTLLFSTIPYSTTLLYYSILPYTIQLYFVPLCPPLLHSILLYPQYSILFYCAITCSTLFYFTPLFSLLFNLTLPCPTLFNQPHTTLLCSTAPPPTPLCATP